MRYCDNCKKEFETTEDACPICGAIFSDIPNDESTITNEYEAAEIISTMMTTGIL